jgi:flagellar basal body-associated protein FliL
MNLAEEPKLPFGVVEIALIIIVLVFVAGVVLAIVYFGFLRKRNKPAQISGANIIGRIPSPPEQYVKRCPKCRSTFTDETLNFCLTDGTPLETFNDSEYETVVRKS